MFDYNQFTTDALRTAIGVAARDASRDTEFFRADLKNKSTMLNALIRNGVPLSNIPQKMKKQKAPRAPRVPKVQRPEGADIKYRAKKLIGPTIPKEIKKQMITERKQERVMLKEQKIREKAAAKVAKKLARNVIKNALANQPKLTKTGKPRRTRAEIQAAKAQRELDKLNARTAKRQLREQLKLEKKQNTIQPLKYGFNPATQSSVYYL
jgi:hypothetical protein